MEDYIGITWYRGVAIYEGADRYSATILGQDGEVLILEDSGIDDIKEFIDDLEED